MKVNLAAQSLSSSVADALDYCNVKLKLSQFQGSEATSKFLRIFDRLFDICNSRNSLAKNFKAPLRKTNQAYVDAFLDEAFSNIISLTDCARHPMHSSRRKTGFIGFLVAIKSLKAMYTDLVAPEPAPLKFLLTYKMSQDHLELFYAAVRSSGGCSNNPTSSQFISIYKQLLMGHQIEGGHGNCIVQDTTSILNAVEDRCSIHEVQTGTSDVALARRYDLELRMPSEQDHDYADVPNVSELSEYKEAAISYIAGYVVKMVVKMISCPKCVSALTVSTNTHSHIPFFVFKDNGGLI